MATPLGRAQLAGEAQDLAFSLFNVCDRNGWEKHARDYNGLIAQLAR